MLWMELQHNHLNVMMFSSATIMLRYVKRKNVTQLMTVVTIQTRNIAVSNTWSWLISLLTGKHFLITIFL